MRFTTRHNYEIPLSDGILDLFHHVDTNLCDIAHGSRPLLLDMTPSDRLDLAKALLATLVDDVVPVTTLSYEAIYQDDFELVVNQYGELGVQFHEPYDNDDRTYVTAFPKEASVALAKVILSRNKE